VPIKISGGRRLDRLRNKVVDTLLPDTCGVYHQVRVVDAAGNVGEPVPEFIEYEGSEDIPCRFDPTRQYRTSDVFGQETLLDDFMVSLPYGVVPGVDYRIVKNGTEFEVRKVLAYQSWGVVSRVMVTNVDLGDES